MALHCDKYRSEQVAAGFGIRADLLWGGQASGLAPACRRIALASPLFFRGSERTKKSDIGQYDV